VKRILAAVILTVFLINLFGIYTVFVVLQDINRKEIQSQIKKKIPLELLTEIVVPLSETKLLHWTRINSEFIYKDKLYDVVKVTTSPSAKKYYCIADEKEQKIICNFLRKSKMHDRAGGKILGKIFTHVFVDPFCKLKIHLPGKMLFFLTPVCEYPSRIIEISSPPPKLFAFN
jgi:hypothetical protein